MTCARSAAAVCGRRQPASRATPTSATAVAAWRACAVAAPSPFRCLVLHGGSSSPGPRTRS
eukprot:scaffold377_cov57-Phaeocystis_antarctica.AAC.1